MTPRRLKTILCLGVIGCAIVGIAGCEISQLATHAASGPPLREDQIALRGPITIYEYLGGRVERSVTLPADDPLVEQLNEWARQHLVGATVTLVDYAPRLYVRGENFSLDFLGELIVVNLWEGRKPAGQWSIAINTVNDSILAKIKARLASSQR